MVWRRWPLWRHWLRGLIGATIGGGANSISAMVIDPEAFNFGAKWKHTIALTVVSALISAALYLKQSPLPDDMPDTLSPNWRGDEKK